MTEASFRSEHLLILAKCPKEGQVKTRLTPPLSQQQATSLYRAFLADLFATLDGISSERSIELSTDSPWPASEPLRPPSQAQLSLQGSGDLGARLRFRAQNAFRSGAERLVILGGDAPDLPKGSIDTLFLALEGSDAAVIPASDGGYVGLALAGPHFSLFQDIPWGGAEVLAVTQRRAEVAGLGLALLPPWHDVDRAADLVSLKKRLTASPAAAPRTAAWLESELWTPV